jgi:Xaa-Pro aminopeptidase
LGETVHRTGRGVGPRASSGQIGAGDKTLLQPGMVVTIRGIYFPHFAVHVETAFPLT